MASIYQTERNKQWQGKVTSVKQRSSKCFMKPGPMRMATSLKRQATSCDKMSRGTMPQITKSQASSDKHPNPDSKAQAAGHKQQAS